MPSRGEGGMRSLSINTSELEYKHLKRLSRDLKNENFIFAGSVD
jgi:hypothetical protein